MVDEKENGCSSLDGHKREILEIKLRHLENDYHVIRNDYENTTKNYLEILKNLEKNVAERTKQVEQIQCFLEQKGIELQVMIDASPAMIFYKDRNLRYIRVNRMFYEQLPFTYNEIIGKTDEQLFSNSQYFNTQCDKRVLATGKPVLGQEEILSTITGDRFFQVDRIPYTDVNQNIIGLIGFSLDVTEQKHAQQALQDREQELELKRKNLEEVHTALKVLLKKREEDKAEHEERVVANIKGLVMPFVEKLKKTKMEAIQKAYVDIIESNLFNILSPFPNRLTSQFLHLTPSEIQIANLIKDGHTTKEVAQLLNLSNRTVDVHRENIRKKIGIHNKKINLRSYLLSLK